MSRELQPCGTYAAYQRHNKAKEDPCDDCKKAKRTYQRAYRELAPRKGSEHSASQKAHQRARSRALARLSRLYNTAYQALLDEELAKEEDYRS